MTRNVCILCVSLLLLFYYFNKYLYLVLYCLYHPPGLMVEIYFQTRLKTKQLGYQIGKNHVMCHGNEKTTFNYSHSKQLLFMIFL